MGRNFLIAMRILFVGGAFILSGCTMAKIGGHGAMPLLLNNPMEKMTVIEHFNASKMITFDYTAAFDVSEIISEKLSKSGADAAINIAITVKSDVGTFFVNLFTLGLAAAKTIQVDGDLVAISGGLGQLLNGKEIIASAETAQELGVEIEKATASGKTISGTAQRNGRLILF